MGSVWLAHDQSLDRLCALKILDPEQAGKEEVRKRFLREARATAQIRSAHVVEVFEHGIWDGLPFIVMEYLEGEVLAARLDRIGHFEPEAAHRVVAQVARGLARAHALGIVHRDLKPENVFLVPTDGEELVKLFDFGIARHVVYSPRDRATQAGAVMGTPCYMAPEQVLGEPADWRVDLWALGVLAFECLTGKLPFFHDALGGLLTQILHDPIPSIRAANPALPAAVETWWRRAVERDPDRRFQNAADLSNALADALRVRDPLGVAPLVPCSETLSVDAVDFEDASASAVEFAAHMGSDAPVAVNTGELVTRFRRKVRRHSAWMWGLVVALFSAFFALGVWMRTRFSTFSSASPSQTQGALPAAPPAPPPRAEVVAPTVEPNATIPAPLPVSEPSPPPSASVRTSSTPVSSEPVHVAHERSPASATTPVSPPRAVERSSDRPLPPASLPPAPSLRPPRSWPTRDAPKKPTRDYGI